MGYFSFLEIPRSRAIQIELYSEVCTDYYAQTGRGIALPMTFRGTDWGDKIILRGEMLSLKMQQE
jgi:hypothetical protein